MSSQNYTSHTQHGTSAQDSVVHLKLALSCHTEGNTLSQLGREVESKVPIPTVDALITEQNRTSPFVHEEQAKQLRD